MSSTFSANSKNKIRTIAVRLVGKDMVHDEIEVANKY